MEANLLTIGTEITSGEVVNSNAAWISLQLEELGIRVLSHITVRDNPDEILLALEQCGAEVVVVTGGLGPTSDDVTRECLASYCGVRIEYDAAVFADLEKLYAQRGLKLREAHKHQCHFPAGSERLRNPVGTALGFHIEKYFVLPGPPRELEAMWKEEVEPRLRKKLSVNSRRWVRWTCLGLPESEVAELVEPLIAETGIEVGYRAAVPYVKVKLYCDEAGDRAIIEGVEAALGESIVARGLSDLAEEFLEQWPLPELRVADYVSDGILGGRLFAAQRDLRVKNAKVPHLGVVSYQVDGEGLSGDGLELRRHGEDFVVTMRAGGVTVNERAMLPYKLSLSSERGRKSAAEWALWFCVKKFRASAR